MPPSKAFEHGKTYEDARRLNLHSELALVTTVITAVVTDPKAFRSDRDLAAWVVLVPRQNSTGGKRKLVGWRRPVAAASDLWGGFATTWCQQRGSLRRVLALRFRVGEIEVFIPWRGWQPRVLP